MRSPHGRVASILRVAAVAVLALSITTPAWAQFGGLKKKLKAQAGQEGVSKAAGAATGASPEAAEATEAAAPGEDRGGVVVLSEDVVNRLRDWVRAAAEIAAELRSSADRYVDFDARGARRIG